MISQPLLSQTRALLEKCDRPLNAIARGAGVGFEWLRKFRADLIPNPGVNHVQALHDWLAANQHANEEGEPARRTANS